MQNVLLNVLNIFRKGYVECNDRVVKVIASNGGFNDDEAYIDLQFEYYENRLLEVEDEGEKIKEILIARGY